MSQAGHLGERADEVLVRLERCGVARDGAFLIRACGPGWAHPGAAVRLTTEDLIDVEPALVVLVVGEDQGVDARRTRDRLHFLDREYFLGRIDEGRKHAVLRGRDEELTDRRECGEHPELAEVVRTV